MCIEKPDSVLCIWKISYNHDAVSIGVVEFIDTQRNDNEMMKCLIKLFGRDDNDVQLYKELTTIDPHD